jgi:protease I
MSSLDNKTIAILATQGFEKSELFEPKRQLEAAGATVQIVSPESGSIKSWDGDDWGESIDVDRSVDDVNVDDFDALVLPGGQINPDVLRTNKTAVALVRQFFNSGKPLAAICHAPWLLIEADVIKGRRVTSYASISTDVKNAGGMWEDSEVVVDAGLITSRNPGDLDAFCSKVIEEIREGEHQRKSA